MKARFLVNGNWLLRAIKSLRVGMERILFTAAPDRNNEDNQPLMELYQCHRKCANMVDFPWPDLYQVQ